MSEEDFEKRLAAARAKRSELETAAAARAVERDQAEQLEAEERSIRDLEAIAKAETDHGPQGRKIAVVRTDLGAVVLKRANPLHYKRYVDQGEFNTEANERLVRQCVVHPPLTTFEAWLQEQPAILVRCANAICALAGVRAKEVEGKS